MERFAWQTILTCSLSYNIMSFDGFMMQHIAKGYENSCAQTISKSKTINLVISQGMSFWIIDNMSPKSNKIE